MNDNDVDKNWEYFVVQESKLDTIKLISDVDKSITILILALKITDIDVFEQEANKLQNKLIIKKVPKIHHDRFILTKGEGWSVGHALKDFGKKTSMLIKLPSSLEAETAFDENWIQLETIFDNSQ